LEPPPVGLSAAGGPPPVHLEHGQPVGAGQQGGQAGAPLGGGLLAAGLCRQLQDQGVLGPLLGVVVRGEEQAGGQVAAPGEGDGKEVDGGPGKGGGQGGEGGVGVQEEGRPGEGREGEQEEVGRGRAAAVQGQVGEAGER
jgi:hypothetical protein